MGKFHSVVVDSRFKKRDLESGVDALKVMAAYIDLNYPSFLRLCKKASHGGCRSRG
jgi:hypothetical protein